MTITRRSSLRSIWTILLLIGLFEVMAYAGNPGNGAMEEETDCAIPPLFAQIWNENFTGLANGAIDDNGTTAWSRTVTTGTLEVQNGLLFFQGVNNGTNGTWISEDIDISNHTNISISYVVADALDAEKETTDYVRGYYILDNGSRIQFGNTTDDVPTPITESVSGLNGNTLRIEIDFRVSYGNETYTIDDILVDGTATGDSQAPTAPAGLAAGAVTTSTVDLTWTAATDNVGVSGYRVYQDNIEIASNVGGTSFQVTGLTEATAYDFTIRAFDAAGNLGANSNTETVTTASSGTGGGSSVWTESGTTASYTGEVAIGRSTVPNGYLLAVDGDIRTREVRVDQDNWPDYVFKAEYGLPHLESVERYINENGHLPGIPTAQEVAENGVELGEMNKLLLEKIEELTLYILKQEKRIKQLENKER
ncbi:fibronectin type III domain-containing protein [Flagellimonas sp. DF-77]|uniref:fibronectin type III domain-containing protein n=1 Tax=Flagellimonas algarum TaxID=3230298 RepID=UPI003392AC0A